MKGTRKAVNVAHGKYALQITVPFDGDQQLWTAVYLAYSGLVHMETMLLGVLLILIQNPKGPCTQYLGTWDLGKSNYSIGIGVYDY